MVSSLLINVAKLGKRVLFASKNNKAVVNAAPVLILAARTFFASVLWRHVIAK